MCDFVFEMFVVAAYPLVADYGVVRVKGDFSLEFAEVANHAECFGVVVVRPFKGGEVFWVFDGASDFFVDFSVQTVKVSLTFFDFAAEREVADCWFVDDEELAIAYA